MTAARPPLPDPFTEIRMTSLRTLRGINYWSRYPVTRMDMSVGAYDAISSAEVPGVSEALLRTMPGLIEHRCSIGERGGFVVRLERGTYAAHIAEHVALELQLMIGHEVGFGRTRGSGAPGGYTLIFEHDHEAVGRRAAVRALEIVRLAFAGTLSSVDRYVAELAALALRPTWQPLARPILCGVTGGDPAARATTQRLLCHRLAAAQLEGCASDERDITAAVEDLSPSSLLGQGVPYRRSRAAIVLDADLRDGVPEPFRERECAVRLVSMLVDAVEKDGIVICRAQDMDVQAYARDRGRHLAVFSVDDHPSADDLRWASVVAMVRDGHICLEHSGAVHDAGTVVADLSIDAQLSAALAAHVLGTRVLGTQVPDEYPRTTAHTDSRPDPELDVAESRAR
jgi:cyanophycin synthase-like protein